MKAPTAATYEAAVRSEPRADLANGTMGRCRSPQVIANERPNLQLEGLNRTFSLGPKALMDPAG